MSSIGHSVPEGHPRITLALEPGTPLSIFFPLFQMGIVITAHVGCSITSFLADELGAGRDTIEKIQSIFLDGSPVDDLDSATVRDGSQLALSAALPGLVGATMRRGGAYASFRSTITYKETATDCASGEGSVRLKLFNLLLDELAPALLAKGIVVKSSELIDLLREYSQEFSKGCREVLFDGRPVGAEEASLRPLLSEHEQVYLSVTSAK
jgi:hypothetical protein